MSDRHGSARCTARRRTPRLALCVLGALLLIAALLGLSPSGAAIAQTPNPPDPSDVPEPIEVPDVPGLPGLPDLPDLPDFEQTGTGGLPTQAEDASDGDTATFALDVPDVSGDSSNIVVIILLMSVLSIAPSLLVLTTSFTRIVIVMSLARNAVGIPSLPPQQVIVGLSLFLSLFIMAPTLGEMNDVGLQPLIAGELSFTEAFEAASDPLRDFMLQYTREGELEMFLDASNTETPVARDEVPLTALIPAFVLSEIKSAFILGFVIFVPFLVIDLVVSAVLTSLGMMMLPPTFVSLPLKLLLFILLDGWTLIVGTLLKSYG